MKKVFGTAAFIGLWWIASNAETLPLWITGPIMIVGITGMILMINAAWRHLND